MYTPAAKGGMSVHIFMLNFLLYFFTPHVRATFIALFYIT